MKSSTKTAIDKAQVLEDNEEYEKAYEVLKNAYAKDASDVELLEKLALTAHILELDDEAVVYWEQSMVLNPNNPVCYSQLMDLYLSKDKYKYYLTRAKLKIVEQNPIQAAADLKKAIDNTIEPDDLLFSRTMLAQIHEALGKPQSAVDEYLRVLDIEKSPEIYLKLAQLYALTNKYDAVDILKRASSEFPDDSDLKSALYEGLVAIGDFSAASEYAQDELAKAKALLLQEKNQEAYTILEALDSKQKSNKDYVMLMAQYYYNTSSFEEAHAWIAKYEKLDPQNPVVFQMRALAQEGLGQQSLAHKNWGRFYLMRGDSELAMNEFMQAHYADAEESSVIYEIVGLAEAKKDKNLAAEFYDKLLKLEPANKQALSKLVEFYSEIGDHYQATEYAQALVDSDLSNLDAILSLAKSYEKLRNKEKALYYYERYLERAPLSPFSDDIKKSVEKLKGENLSEDEGLLEKILGFFTRK